MRSKGSLGAADEVLQRMLTLDPGNAYALLLQGKNLLESGDGAGAVAALQKISDIDSNPDGLRDLLKAYLLTGQLSEAGTVANKLLTVHNDLPAIASFADALMQAGQYENALQVFDQHAERLLAENSDKVLKSLHSIIGHVYAIVRFDSGMSELEDCATVVKVLTSPDSAEQEAIRLRTVNQGERCTYVVQTTRLVTKS